MATVSQPPHKPSTKPIPPFDALEVMGDADLIAQFEVARISGFYEPMEFFLGELSRRRMDRQTNALVRLTWALMGLTVALVLLALATLWVAA